MTKGSLYLFCPFVHSVSCLEIHVYFVDVQTGLMFISYRYLLVPEKKNWPLSADLCFLVLTLTFLVEYQRYVTMFCRLLVRVHRQLLDLTAMSVSLERKCRMETLVLALGKGSEIMKPWRIGWPF